MYINDISMTYSNCETISYTDVIVLLFLGNNWDEVPENTEEDFKETKKRLEKNLLSLNMENFHTW